MSDTPEMKWFSHNQVGECLVMTFYSILQIEKSTAEQFEIRNC